MQSILETEPKESSASQKSIGKLLLFALAVFLTSFLLAIVFHLLDDGPKRTLCFDARQYIFDTARISEFMLSALHGKAKPELVTDPAFLSSILADGPAFPGFFATIFTVIGHAPDIADCLLIQIIQSFMHAVSATCIFFLSFLLSKNSIAALISGLCWGTYPAAIFFSGIFYTETTVIMFSLLFLSCLSKAQRLLPALSGGLLAGMVALLKPALLPAAALSSLFALRLSRKSFLFIAVGAAISLAPWLAYTKLMTGKAQITAQRFPAFNLAMGADTEVDACFVSPAPALTTMFSREHDSPIAFPLSQWQFHTADCLRLSAVKLSALWSKQANDYRESYFGLPPVIQNYWHLFLLFSGISGLLFFLSRWRDSALSKSQEIAATASLIFILSHFSYVLFTPAARYGMTSMPFFLIFASSCFAAFWPAINGKLRLRFIASLGTAAILITLLVNAASLSPIFKAGDREIQIFPGEKATRTIDLASVKKPSSIYTVLLLVDGDDSVEAAELSVNGRKLSKGLRHIRQFSSTLYEQSFELRSLGYPAGISTDEFRHWRAIELEPNLLNWQGKNEITLSAKNKPAKLFADISNTRRMLSLDFFSINNLCNSDSSYELRIPSPITTGNVNSESILERVRGSLETLNSPLRFKLAVVLGPGYVAQSESSSEIFSARVPYKSFDLYLQNPAIEGLRTNRIAIRAARSSGATIDIPELSSRLVRVEVDGEIQGKKNGKAELIAALQPAAHSAALVLNLRPAQLQYEKDWKSFHLEDVVPTILLDKKKKKSLYLAVYPGPWLDYSGYVPDKRAGDVQYRNLRVKITAEDAPDIAGRRVLFY